MKLRRAPLAATVVATLSAAALPLAASAASATSAAPSAPSGSGTAFVNWSHAGKDVQQSNDNPAETQINASTVRNLTPAWSTTAPVGQGDCYGPNSLPVLGGGRLFRTLSSGSLQARNPNTGALLWATPTNPENLLSQPAYYGGRVYVESSDGCSASGGADIEAYDAATGKLVWHTSGPNNFSLSDYFPVVGNTIYTLAVAADDGNRELAAVSTKTGKTLWQVGVDNATPRPYRFEPVVGQQVYETSGGALIAFSRTTGKTVWHSSAAVTPLAVWKAQHLVLASAKNSAHSNLVAIDETTGKVRWSITEAAGPLAVSNSLLVTGCGAHVCGYHANGKRAFRTADGFGAPDALSMAGNVIYESVINDVVVYDTAGHRIFTDNVNSHTKDLVAVANGYAYVSNDRVLDAYTLPKQ